MAGATFDHDPDAMPDSNDLGADLHFVRDAVARDRRSDAMPAIHLLWGALGAVGFLVQAWRPEGAAVAWVSIGIVGFGVSAFLGYRGAVRGGSMSRATGRVQLSHWGALLLSASLLGAVLGWNGSSTTTIGYAVMVLLIQAYGHAAVHIARAYGWYAAGLVIGLALVLWSGGDAWQLAAFAYAASAIAAAVSSRRTDA